MSDSKIVSTQILFLCGKFRAHSFVRRSRGNNLSSRIFDFHKIIIQGIFYKFKVLQESLFIRVSLTTLFFYLCELRKMTTAPTIWIEQLKKLDDARSRLKDKIGHWRKEWQEEITKWSEEIVLTQEREGVNAELTFPAGHDTKLLAAIDTNNKSNDNRQNLFSYIITGFGQHNFPLSVLISKYAAGVKMATPINLLVEAIQYFVSALTGNKIIENTGKLNISLDHNCCRSTTIQYSKAPSLHPNLIRWRRLNMELTKIHLPHRPSF